MLFPVVDKEQVVVEKDAEDTAGAVRVMAEGKTSIIFPPAGMGSRRVALRVYEVVVWVVASVGWAKKELSASWLAPRVIVSPDVVESIIPSKR